MRLQAFPNEPFGPCAITTGAAGRWSLTPGRVSVKPPKKRIPQKLLDAAKMLRHAVRSTTAFLSFLGVFFNFLVVTRDTKN